MHEWAQAPTGLQLMYKKDGTCRSVTGAQVIAQFIQRAGNGLRIQTDGTGLLEIAYRHSAKGADMVAAGFIADCRLYAVGADPFKLPSLVRALALARFGIDFDDAASFPHALAFLLRVGKKEANFFLMHRKPILAAIGAYFFDIGEIGRATCW